MLRYPPNSTTSLPPCANFVVYEISQVAFQFLFYSFFTVRLQDSFLKEAFPHAGSNSLSLTPMSVVYMRGIVLR